MREDHKRTNIEILKNKLRNNTTPAEATLWKYIKARQIDGFLFHRQYCIGKYILDFYCPSAKLCIEMDGSPHFTIDGFDHDTIRTDFLEEKGIKVIRFENKSLFIHPQAVLDAIRIELNKSL